MIIVALDKDASKKSIEIRKFLQLICKDVRIVLLEKDLKDSSVEQVKKVLGQQKDWRFEDFPPNDGN